MSNYILFAGLTYYPAGGAKDHMGVYAERGKAIDDGRASLAQGTHHWWHVYAIDQQRIVACGDVTVGRSPDVQTETIDP